jgi:two-component sensor histidine kinase
MNMNTANTQVIITGSNSMIYRDRGGRILIANEKGIAVYNAHETVLKPVSLRKQANSPDKSLFINDVYDDGKNIWIATAGSGLFRCDRNLEVINNYTTENGLCDNTIYCIQANNSDELWLTTNRGLSIFNIPLKIFSNYFQLNGLPAQEFMPLGKVASASGTLYFSTTKGIIQTRPATWPNPGTQALQVFITKVLMGNEVMERNELSVINQMQVIETDYGKSISLAFSSTGNYLNQRDNGLQYKINKDQWREMGWGSELLFDGLQPGKHKLYVRSVLNNEHMAGDPFILTIFVRPAYFQQWWFYLLGAMSVMCIIYLLYRYRVNELRKFLTVRTKISQDLHDEVGATLSGIAMYSHLTREQLKASQTSEIEKSLNVIQQAASEMVNKLNDIVWVVNPKNDSLQKMIEKLEDYARETAAVKKMEVVLNISPGIPETKLPMDSRRNIYLFCKEAINNSVKYSKATILELTVRTLDHSIEFSVKDNGEGFNVNSVKKGNGLENMRKRANEIGAKFTLRSDPGEGVIVNLRCSRKRS